MTANQLRQLEVRYQTKQYEAELCRDKRNAAVRAALAGGWTHQQIADATGLTRGRISQIKAQIAVDALVSVARSG